MVEFFKVIMSSLTRSVSGAHRGLGSSGVISSINLLPSFMGGPSLTSDTKFLTHVNNPVRVHHLPNTGFDGLSSPTDFNQESSSDQYYGPVSLEWLLKKLSSDCLNTYYDGPGYDHDGPGYDHDGPGYDGYDVYDHDGPVYDEPDASNVGDCVNYTDDTTQFGFTNGIAFREADDHIVYDFNGAITAKSGKIGMRCNFLHLSGEVCTNRFLDPRDLMCVSCSIIEHNLEGIDPTNPPRHNNNRSVYE